MKWESVPRTVADTFSVNAEHVEQAIDAEWDRITAAQAAGQCTDAQVRHLLKQEADWGNDGKTSTRWVFSKFLRAQANNPASIGVHLNDAPYTCRCFGAGWIFDDDTGDVTPCIGCNQPMYEIWAAGCLRPNHQCEKCAPRRRRRAPGASHTDETVAERVSAEQVQQHYESELF